MTAISIARWLEAQDHEAAYWAKEAEHPTKLLADVADGHHFTAGLLDIRPLSLVFTDAVLDIAGGPYPLGRSLLEGGWIDRYDVLDPAPYPTQPGVRRIEQRAECYDGDRYDEVWGYNVLQHVIEPSEVIATARRAALTRIRWFDVVETPIYPVHPHSIKADWLRAQLSIDGFRVVRDIDGSRLVEGQRQKWVALVAERT